MSSSVIPDITPAELLGRMRGPIFKANIGYPEVMMFKIRDAESGEWWFATFDANFSPTDPDALLGKTVVRADLEEGTANLTIGFSDGSVLEVTGGDDEPDDDLETWSLLTPDDLALNYGPGNHWKLTLAGDPI
jgi:hypothetical protein